MAVSGSAIIKTIRREGGDKITEDPADPGGLTKYGIAKRYHPEIDIRNLTLEEATAIYKKEYWDTVRADEIQSQSVAEMLFDAAVNPGVDTAIKIARTVLGLPPSGGADSDLMSHINSTDPVIFATAFTLAKIARYVFLVKQNKAKQKYFFGWVNRALEGAG